MRAGKAFARQGTFPTDNAGKLALALSLLEQRTADKFEAIDRSDGDLIGTWHQYLRPTLGTGGNIGNGKLTAQWRRLGGQGVQVRYLLQFGGTTTIAAGGIIVALPPGYTIDTSLAQDDGSGTRYVPMRATGKIGGVNTGFLGSVAIVGTVATIVAAGLATLAAGDIVLLEIELPVKAAS